uniref:Uncharacterized protein n=1 Tax=Romanomermis culicivorax TaxID=13658 RepID=A0A915JK19_ROMCU
MTIQIGAFQKWDRILLSTISEGKKPKALYATWLRDQKKNRSPSPKLRNIGAIIPAMHHIII